MKGTLLLLLVISLFLGFVFGGALIGNLFPSVFFRIADPVVCQGKMEIVSRQYSYKPGSVSVEHKVYCLDAAGTKRDITFEAVVISCLILSGVIFLLFCLNLLVKRLRGGPSETAPAVTAPPVFSPQPMPARQVDLTGDDPTELLRKLKELRQADLISDQEYEAKKAEILNKM
jgi:hypothetical protein